MTKHKTREEWINLFLRYEKDDWDWDDYCENHVIRSQRLLNIWKPINSATS